MDINDILQAQGVNKFRALCTYSSEFHILKFKKCIDNRCISSVSIAFEKIFELPLGAFSPCIRYLDLILKILNLPMLLFLSVFI